MKSSLITLLAYLLLSLTASAAYWGAKGDVITEKSDMAMFDINYPYFSATTYYMSYYHHLASGVPGNKDRMGFYAGSTYYGKDGKGVDSTSLQLTYWPASNKGPIIPLWAYPGCNRTMVMNEGAACGMGGLYPLKAGQWYRNVLRFWKPENAEEAKKKSYAGWWIKNLNGEGKWRLVQAAEIPIADARFHSLGLGGCLECTYFVDKGPKKIRTASYRNLYTHRDGKWDSAYKFFLPAPTYQQLVLSKEGSVATVRTHPTDPFEGAKKITSNVSVELKQKPQPTLGAFAFSSAEALQNGNNILVSWQTSESSTPQMRSQIEVLDASGKAIFKHETNNPSVTEKFLELEQAQIDSAKSVKITLTSIFAQSTTKTINLGKTEERCGIQPVELADPDPGVKTFFHELPSGRQKLQAGKTYANWDKLPDIDTIPLKEKIFQNNVSLDSIPRKFGIAFRSKSHLKINKTGLYRFHFSACDGGRMLLGGKVFIQQKIHHSGNSVSQWIILDKGYYPVVLEGYSDQGRGRDFLRPRLELSYEGPGIKMQPVPSSVLFLGPETKRPGIQVAWSAKPRRAAESNTVDIRLVSLGGKDSELEKIEIVDANGTVWATFSPTEFSRVKSILLPEHDHLLSTRVSFKNKDVIDLSPQKVSVKNPAAKFWTLVATDGKPARAFGHRVTKESITLMGDGRRWAVREVSGDFVYQMRVKNFRNIVNELRPVSNDPKAVYGFSLQAKAKSPYDYKGFNWSNNMYGSGHYDTPTRHDGGLAQDDYYKSAHRVPYPVCYFRFSRKGDHFKAELRATEQEPWKLLFEETVKLPNKVFIGPYMRYAPTIDPHSYWRADFDQISVKASAP